MVSSYVNITNTTLANVTTTSGTISAFRRHRRRYMGTSITPSPPTPPPHEGNPPRDKAFLDEFGKSIDLPKLLRDNGLDERYTFAGKERGDPELLPEGNLPQAECGDDGAILVRVKVRTLLQTDDARQEFFTRVYGVTVDYEFKRFDIRPCLTEIITNIRLETDSAPSPPPPNDWNKPPSPPAFVYELTTLAVASSSSALFFLVGAVCCLGIGGGNVRSRLHSRFYGTGRNRVDKMLGQERAQREEGQFAGGIFGPDLAIPSASGFFKNMVNYDVLKQQ